MASLKIGVLGKMGFFGKGGPLVKMEDFVDFGNLLGTFGAKWRQNPLISLYYLLGFFVFHVSSIDSEIK